MAKRSIYLSDETEAKLDRIIAHTGSSNRSEIVAAAVDALDGMLEGIRAAPMSVKLLRTKAAERASGS